VTKQIEGKNVDLAKTKMQQTVLQKTNFI